jgi:glycosyltransferase involved in cell wall biosynthesis
MSQLFLPSWIKPYLEKKDFYSMSEKEVSYLKTKLAKFDSMNPDVSIMIPAYNEETRIFRTLASLADNITNHNVELAVINNNSTDRTQEIVDILGVKSYFQPEQGIAFARQMGLSYAKGKYHLCADSDSIYPPNWIEKMIKPMIKNKEIVGVYGRYSIIPPNGQGRFGLWIYETCTGVLFRLRQSRREHMNFLGFNMGFVTEIGRKMDGFEVERVRLFSNSKNSNNYTVISEDGQMAVQLKKVGKLRMITSNQVRVYTSARKLLDDGGIAKAFFVRLKTHSKKIFQYYLSKSPVDSDKIVY